METSTNNETLVSLEADSADADSFSPSEDGLSAAGRLISQWIVVALAVMMGVEMLVRSLFGWSIQFSNEIGGYALVAVAFLSLGSGQLLHAYHRVHFVESRLSPVGRAMLRMVFDVASLGVTVVLALEFVRFEWITWQSGDVAATSLMTPQWIPRMSLPLGALILGWALIRTVLADWRRLQSARRGQGA
jgi:TRAP-type C4-dicarboxylate transport system permease small subunit